MIFINKDTELTPVLLRQLITQFMTHERPTLQKRKEQYTGKHAILRKTYEDPNKPCNRVVTNYCKIITDTYSGYIAGKPVAYTSNDSPEAIEDIQEVLNYNDVAAQDIAFLKNALIYGVAYELQWLDRDGKTRFSQMDPLHSFAIYDNSLDNELLYFIRWYKADSVSDSDVYRFEVYDNIFVDTYEAYGEGGELALVEEGMHFIQQVPVSVFMLNDEQDNIFDSIVTLNDAYNELQSGEIDEFMEYVNAYLTFSGMDGDENTADEIRFGRLLFLPEGTNAQWLIKNMSDTQIENMLDNIKKNIFKVTACPDMADETFLAQSGTALAYKLVGFENVASGIVANMTKALQRRVELICNILNLKATEAVWRDIQITFTRNLPQNITETVQLVNSLKGIVSDKTLLAQIPFIDDVNEELEALAQQKKDNMALYSFPYETETEETDEGAGIEA